MALRTDCTRSRIKNISGVAKRFSFLPPHGLELEAGEDIAIAGDIYEAVAGGVAGTKRHMRLRALEDALQDQELQILQTPAVIVRDSDLTPKMLDFNNGVVVGVTPCWLTTSSESVSEVA